MIKACQLRYPIQILPGQASKYSKTLPSISNSNILIISILKPGEFFWLRFYGIMCQRTSQLILVNCHWLAQYLDDRLNLLITRSSDGQSNTNFSGKWSKIPLYSDIVKSSVCVDKSSGCPTARSATSSTASASASISSTDLCPVVDASQIQETDSSATGVIENNGHQNRRKKRWKTDCVKNW